MLAFIFNIILLASEAAGGESAYARFQHWWHTNADPYLNYPGFEAWKFLNLAIFVYILYRLLNKPLSEGFKAKREEIRSDLIKAEAEKQAALARLTDAEAKLAGAETESKGILDRAKAEAKAEKARIAKEAEAEAARLREQAENEITRTALSAKMELRKYSAEESIRRAEEIIKQGMSAEADAKLVKANIQSIGGLN